MSGLLDATRSGRAVAHPEACGWEGRADSSQVSPTGQCPRDLAAEAARGIGRTPADACNPI